MTPNDSTPERKRGPWSQAEIERVRRLYGTRQDASIANELGRTPDSVRRMAKTIFSGEKKQGPWSATEVQRLKKYLGAASIEVISQILRRSETEIHRKIEELGGLVAERPWTSEDIQTLKRLYGTRSDADLVLILGRPIESIFAKVEQLCLARDKSYMRRVRRGPGHTRMPRWTKEEEARLRELYANTPNLEIAKELGRTVKSVVSKAHDLQLRKSPERLKQMGRENVDIRYNGLTGDDGGVSGSADSSE